MRMQFALLLLCLSFPCCAPKPGKPESLMELTPGSSRVEVERVIGATGTHQFTALLNGHEYVCVSHTFHDPRMRYYIVYCDEAFMKITDDMRQYFYDLEGESSCGWPDSFPKDCEQRMQAVVDAQPVSCDDLRDGIDWRRKVEAWGRENAEPNPALLLAVAITVPLEPMTWPRKMKEHAIKQEFLRQYDPWQIHLGMTGDQVDDMLGEPRRIVPQGDHQVRIYGEFADIQHGGGPEHSWSAVILQSDSVVRVFSHDFFDVSLRGSQSTYPEELATKPDCE